MVSEIYTYSPLAICFFDHDHVSQPFGVTDFFNEMCLQQFADFFGYGFVSLGQDSLLLLDWREGRVHVEFVNHGIRANPWHVLMAPSEDILIVFRKRASSSQIKGSTCVSIRVIQPEILSSKEISSKSFIGSTVTLLSSMFKAYK